MFWKKKLMFCLSEDSTNWVKRQATEGEETFTEHIADKRSKDV